MGQNISQRSSKVSLKWILDESYSSNSSKRSTKRTTKHKRPIDFFCRHLRYRKSSSSVKSKTNRNNILNNSDACKNVQINKNSNVHGNGSKLYSPFPFNTSGSKKNVFNFNGNNSGSECDVNIFRQTATSNTNNNYINHDGGQFKTNNDLAMYLSYCDLNNGNFCNIENTYSDQFICVGGSSMSRQSRKCKHKRRKRKDLQRFGYNIRDLDEFLSKCSLSSPGNIPFVLSAPSTLYQTRPGGYQTELTLPLGMVVNAVFKNQNWLYVQTPHAEEGYISYAACLPLGILPQPRRKSECWETSCDVFPKPCGNVIGTSTTRRDTARSEGSQTPRIHRRRYKSMCSEKNIDTLYLRATTKITESEHYNQSRRNNKLCLSLSGLDEFSLKEEYVRLLLSG